MEVEFRDKHLDRLEVDATADSGSCYPPAVIKAYRKRMQLIRAAEDERDFKLLGAGNFEKLKGDRQHQYAMRLNDQWRLVLELKRRGSQRVVVIVGIEDYH